MSKSTKLEILLKTDGIYVADEFGESTRIANAICVTAFGQHDVGPGGTKAVTIVTFVDRDGKTQTEIVSAAMLGSQWTQFVTHLEERGYVWPAGRFPKAIVEALAREAPSKRVSIYSVPGWHCETFLLPGEAYTKSGPNQEDFLLLRGAGVPLGEFKREGSLDGWKKKIGKACIHSTRARFAVAAAFAGPNLRPLNIPSFGLNFSGLSSNGKTVCLRMASSVVGVNSPVGPATWDGTPTGFEQRALGHRDNVVLLDDTSHLTAPELAKSVTFRMSAGRTKTRAAQYASANQLIETDWHVIALSTSEDPIWQANKSAGRQVRGEEVRMVNIPACVSSMKDVFDGENADDKVGTTVEGRRKYVEALEKAALEHQGKPYRAYLAQRCADPDAVATLKKYMDDFIRELPLLEEQRPLVRIRKYFAVIYASAVQAIDYDILPWSQKKTLRAIQTCMQDAMKELSQDLTPMDEDLLADFKNRVNGAKSVRVGLKTARSRQLKQKLADADIIIKEMRPGRVRRYLQSEVVRRWYPDRTSRDRLTKVAVRAGLVKPGSRPDSFTRQVKVSPLPGKPSVYYLGAKKLFR